MPLLSGVVDGPSGALNGAQVDAWLASRFTIIPAAGTNPPSGSPDAGPILTGTNFGGPGQWELTVPSTAAYYVRVTYPVGSTNARSYWAYDNTLVQSQGPQGAQGANGAQGTAGATGSTGSQGYQGNQGATGSQGPQGAQGTQGFQGVLGAQGNQGYQGYQGYQGLTGPQGTQGTQGNTGVQGPQGNQGLTGPQGSTGSQGTQGSTGTQGPQGYQGLTGAGTQGAQGAQGPQGYQGNQGAQGAGTQGAQGAQGAQGGNGNQGLPVGLTGATAATRYVGGTANGAPTSGTFAVGDFVVDQTGTIWVCTTAGTPGTWTTTISSHLSLRTASATVGRNEITIFSGSTASQTLTAPSSPIDGSNWTVINKASVAVTLSFTPSMIPLSSGTGVTTFSIPAGGSYSFINYNGSQWYMVATNSADQLINVLPTANGGTGLSTIGTAGQVLTVNSGATALQYSTPTAPAWNFVTRTSSATVAAGETTYSNTNGLTFTLPTAPPNGTANTFIVGSTYLPTIARGGSTDTIAHSGLTGVSSLYVNTGDVATFTYSSANSTWYVTSSGSLSSNYASTVTGTLPVGSGGTGSTSATAARGQLGIAPATVFPSVHGVKAWTFDPAAFMTAGTFTPTKGVAYATRIHMTTGATVSSIGFFPNATGTSVANAYISLYSSAGAVLGYGALPSLVPNTYQTVTLTAVGSLSLSADTDYFVVIQIGTSSSASPTFYQAGDANGTNTPAYYATLMNFANSTAANTLTGRCSSWGTTLNTIPAAVTGTPAFTVNNFFATLS